MRATAGKILRFVAGVLVCVSMTTSALAHHSQTQFDLSKTISVEGTLSEIAWSNPHTFFDLQGRDIETGQTQSWGIEGPSPLMMEKAGINKNMLTVGEKVTIVGNPRKDGKPEMLLQAVTLSDGRSISVKPDAPAVH